MTFTIYMAVFALNFLDLWTTLKGLQKGGREANPAIRWLMAKIGTGPALAVKMMLISVVLAAAWPSLWFGIAALVIYTAICANNLWQLTKA